MLRLLLFMSIKNKAAKKKIEKIAFVKITEDFTINLGI